MCTAFGCDPLVGGGRRAGAKPTGHIDLPRHTEPGRAALGRGATTRIVVDPGDRGTEVRQQRGTPDRLAGSRGTHALGRDFHIAVFASRALDEIGQHGVAEAFPPRDLRGSLGLRAAAAKLPGTSTSDCKTGVVHAPSVSTTSPDRIAGMARANTESPGIRIARLL